MMDSAGWAAVATGVSAVVIAWQAFETRRTADAAKRTLGLAQQTLELARAESAAGDAGLAASRQMVAEAAKQRRDARTRLIQIEVVGLPMVVSVEVFGDPQPLPEGTEYHLPRDGGKLIGVRQELYIRSADSGPIYLDRQGLAVAGQPEGGLQSPQLLARDEILSCRFDTRRSVADWVRIAEQRASGAAGDEGSAWISVHDDFDDGVIDTYEPVMSGTPLIKDISRDGVWHVRVEPTPEAQDPLVAFDRKPMARNYWISKVRNQHLD